MREAFNVHRFDAPLLQLIKQNLTVLWHEKTKDKLLKQYQAWACKYLAASGDAASRKLLDEIAATGPNKYVSKHAKVQLKVYKGFNL